ncbi:MAG: dephospho-CoA kinase [Muribaculum sp.]|nr:dephospho-CoA kinase [Muribaculum sp.]
MNTIGIGGGIGSGKSVVSRILRLRGYAVYDCDSEARRIMDESEEVLSALNIRFGDDVCPVQGPIDRAALAIRVFGSDEHRLWLNALVHRLVRSDIEAWRDSIKRTGAKVCYVESAILFTSGLVGMCDEILLVTAPQNVRIERVMTRDNTNEQDILNRINSQQEEEKLILESDIPVRLIDNADDSSLLSIKFHHP